jgi:erythromycin esterase-like protein
MRAGDKESVGERDRFLAENCEHALNYDPHGKPTIWCYNVVVG